MPLACLLLIAVAPQAEPVAVRVERAAIVMGTVATVEVDGRSSQVAEAAADAAIAALHATDRLLSTWNPASELSSIRALAVSQTVTVSASLAEILTRARAWRDATDGAFEPVVGALVSAWGIREGGVPRAPTQGALDAALRRVGEKALRIEARQVQRLVAGAWIDAGAFGKGAGLDAALAAVAKVDATARCVIDLGGQLAWRLGTDHAVFAIADPARRERIAATVRVTGSGSLATTGNSERAIEVDRQRRSHVLDPRCGRPAADIGSITVLCESALDADCLSTGLFVLGMEAAIEFARARHGIGVIGCERTHPVTVRVSPCLRGRVAVAAVARLAPHNP